MNEPVVYACSVFMIVIAFCVGIRLGECSTRNIAIREGVAEWRIDSKSGEKNFYWLANKTNEISYHR